MDSENVMYGQYIVPKANELVKFGVGQPSTKLLSLELLNKGLSFTSNIKNPLLLQYGDIPGYENFRKDLSNYLSKYYDANVNHKNLFVTNGVTDALSLFCSLFSNKNTIVYVEEPTYFLAINIFKNDYNFKIKTIPINKDGIDINILQNSLKEDIENYENILLYTIPTFHNPTSYNMSDENRKKLSKLVDFYNDKFYVIADEVYQMLYFDNKDKPNLPLCYYNSKIISLGSFSKILAPSLRLGWMQINDESIMKKFIDCGQLDSSGGKSPLIQSIVHGIIKDSSHVEFCRNFLKERCDALSELVTNKLSEFVEFEKPNGGYFLWIKIKDPFKADDVLSLASKYKIQFVPGYKFSSYKKCENYMRLSFSYYDPEDFVIGIDRLNSLFNELKENCYNEQKKNKYNVGILGYKGRLGSKIANLLKNNNNISFEKGLDKNFTNEDLKYLNLIVDVSSPIGTKYLLEKIKDLKIPLIIGTTGLDNETFNIIQSYSLQKKVPVFLISNFSNGIQNIKNMIELIDFKNNNYNYQIEEKHHSRKLDSPSGTAKELNNKIKEVMVSQNLLSFNDEINSIREHDEVGEHTININNEFENIQIKHNSYTRDLFSQGALNYINWMKENSNNSFGLFFSLEDKIKFSKYSGAGNDFIIFNDNILENNKLKFNSKNVSDFVKEISATGNSVGADGVIFIDHNPSLKNSKQIFNWSFYNNDGNSVSMCGNGIRCVTQYILDNNLKDKNISNLVFKNNFDISCDVFFDLNNNFKIKMPKVKQFSEFSPIIPSDVSPNIPDMLIPLIFDSHFVDISVPHVIFNFNKNNIELPSPNNIAEYYRNVGISHNINLIKENENNISIRTFERGVENETNACGTGCCASAYYLYQKSNKKIKNFNFLTKLGYTINVDIDDQENIYLSGHAKKIFKGELCLI